MPDITLVQRPRPTESANFGPYPANRLFHPAKSRVIWRHVQERRWTPWSEGAHIEVHRFAGELLHDRIIGALKLGCRRGEMLKRRATAHFEASAA